jgi:hypothetical protein
MEIILLALQLVIILGLVILQTSGKSYLNEKGKNLATKEDIGRITSEVERVKSQFQLYQLKHSIYHQKQFEVESGVYQRLHDAVEFVNYMVHPVQFGGDEAEGDRRQKGIEAYNDLSGFYFKNKIFLRKDTCEKVEAILEPMRKAISNYQIGRDIPGGKDSAEMWKSAWHSMRDDVPQLRDDLENHFRELIETIDSPDV